MKKRLILLTTSLTTLVAATGAVALAQTEAAGDVGYITSISGSEVLVEEDPAGEWGGGKGYYTVTAETQILRQQDGALVPAAFEDLQVGQLVEAAYSGPIQESYPTRGGASSIVILGEDYGDNEVRCLLPEGCGPEIPPDGSGATQYDIAA